MSADKKPRLAEMLGVEVGEIFSVPDVSEQEVYINALGSLCGAYLGGNSQKYTSILCEAINYPESIQRKRAPRWTLEDIADAEAVRQLWQYAVSAERDRLNGFLYILDAKDVPIVKLDQEIFPELQPGEIVTLSEIMEAENG